MLKSTFTFISYFLLFRKPWQCCQHDCPYCRNPFYFVFMTNFEHISTQRSLEGWPHILKMPKLSFPPLHLNYTFNKPWIFENYLHIDESLEGICQEDKLRSVQSQVRNGGLCGTQMKVWEWSVSMWEVNYGKRLKIKVY